MPNGRTHAKATALLSIGLGLSAILWDYPELSLSACAGCLTGILLSPDLDLADKGNISHGFVGNYGGPLLYAIWSFFWYPYGKAFKHRSKYSHSPIIGTLIRLLYIWILLGIPILFLVGFEEVVELFQMMFILDYGSYLLAAITGLVLADSLHFLMDGLPNWRVYGKIKKT